MKRLKFQAAKYKKKFTKMQQKEFFKKKKFMIGDQVKNLTPIYNFFSAPKKFVSRPTKKNFLHMPCLR